MQFALLFDGLKFLVAEAALALQAFLIARPAWNIHKINSNQCQSDVIAPSTKIFFSFPFHCCLHLVVIV